MRPRHSLALYGYLPPSLSACHRPQPQCRRAAPAPAPPTAGCAESTTGITADLGDAAVRRAS